MSRLNREKASAFLPWNLPHAMSVDEWLDALEGCIEPEICDDDAPKTYEVRLIVESWGSKDDVRNTIYEKLSPTGLMPRAIRVLGWSGAR